MANLQYEKAVFIKDYTAKITFLETKQNSEYPFYEFDELQFSDCEIYQQRGICTFYLIINGLEAWVYVPSSVLTWHVATRKLTPFFDWVKNLDWSTTKKQ